MVEDSAEGLVLPDIRLFRSFLGFPFSVSDVGDRNMLVMLRSLDGVVAGVVTAESLVRFGSGISNLLSDDLGPLGFSPPGLCPSFSGGVGRVGVTVDTFSSIWPPENCDLFTPPVNASVTGLGSRDVGLELGDLREGIVLLRATPILGLLGTDLFDDTETFRLIPPCFRNSSAAALAVDGDRLTPASDRLCVLGLDGVSACSSSSELPLIPIKK